MGRLLKLVVAGAFCATSFIGCGVVDPLGGATCDFKDVKVNSDVTAGGSTGNNKGEVKFSYKFTN